MFYIYCLGYYTYICIVSACAILYIDPFGCGDWSRCQDLDDLGLTDTTKL